MYSAAQKQFATQQAKGRFYKIMTNKWKGYLDGFDEYNKDALVEYLIERSTHFCPDVNNKLIDHNSFERRLCRCINRIMQNDN